MHKVSILIYVMLMTATLFSSKFVLTSLGFQYPMVFQGWQTLVGFLLYRGLHHFKVIEITPMDRSGFISLLPTFMFFTSSILSGSMALTKVPILSHLAVSSYIPVLCFLFSEGVRKNKNKKGLIASGIIVASCFGVICIEQLSGQEEGYFWLEVHIVFTVANSIYSRITDARYDTVDKQYYSYLFSLIVLFPASLYVNEAFEALNFKELYQIMFIVGSLVCAVSGMLLNFYQTRLKGDKRFGFVHHFALLFVGMTSLACFDLDFKNIWSIPLCVASLLTLLFVPTHILPEENVENGTTENDSKGISYSRVSTQEI